MEKSEQEQYEQSESSPGSSKKLPTVDTQTHHFEIYNDSMLDALVDMTAECVEQEDVPPYIYFPTPDSIISWYQRYSAARRVVAFLGDTLVGHIAISFNILAEANIRRIIESSHRDKKGIADIGRFLVTPNARSYGVARTLLYEAQRFSSENERIPYLNIFEQQEETHEHYLKSGWEKIGSVLVRKKYPMSVFKGAELLPTTRG